MARNNCCVACVMLSTASSSQALAATLGPLGSYHSFTTAGPGIDDYRDPERHRNSDIRLCQTMGD
jgi:hypothetical protein